MGRLRKSYPEAVDYSRLGETFLSGAVDHEEQAMSVWHSLRLLGDLPDFPAEVLRQLRLITGHFPYAYVHCLPFRPVTMTVLRHPVDRTISYLGNGKSVSRHAGERVLREIYEDPVLHPRMIRDHQTKVLSMSLAQAMAARPIEAELEELRTELDSGRIPDITIPTVIRVSGIPAFADLPQSRSTLLDAQRNLEEIDHVGITEDLDEFWSQLVVRYGFRDAKMVLNVGGGPDVSRAFRRRIEEDNALDMELYQFARDLVSARRARL